MNIEDDTSLIITLSNKTLFVQNKLYQSGGFRANNQLFFMITKSPPIGKFTTVSEDTHGQHDLSL